MMTGTNRRRTAVALTLLALATAGGWYALGRGKTDKPLAIKPPPLVSVAVAEPRDLAVKLATQGHLVTLNQVDVRPQADGIIRAVHFHEGDEVKAGQLLFSIDATDATTALARAEAQAAQYKAQVDDAQRDLLRTRQLATSHFYSSSAVDTSASKLESLQAQHRAALADIATARAQLARTRIVAPISGLTGALAVHPGSLAQQSAAAPLVTLVQIDTIGVDFTLPEGQLGDLLRARAANQVKVTLQTPDGTPVEGKLVFVNNTVNTDTATINLKASFPNPKKTLWPGAYAKVTVDAGTSRSAITLPSQAVLEGPDGRFVYVLDAQNKVAARPVKLLRIQDQRAVVEGLTAGERVVAEGNLGVKPGTLVQVSAPGRAASAGEADALAMAGGQADGLHK
jgi:RND family efflux transporter MFP subunit